MKGVDSFDEQLDQKLAEANRIVQEAENLLSEVEQLLATDKLTYEALVMISPNPPSKELAEAIELTYAALQRLQLVRDRVTEAVVRARQLHTVAVLRVYGISASQ